MIDLGTVMEIGGWIIAGVLGLAGIFSATTKSRRQENDALTTGLINNLQKTVDVQKTDIEIMQHSMKAHTEERTAELKKMSDKIVHLEGRNSLLEDLFKGRDPAMQSVFAEAPAIFAIARESHAMAKANSDVLLKLADSINELVRVITPKLTQ